jgi:ankyrin repeat protein
MGFSQLREMLILYDIYCYLDFKDSINLRKTDKFFNESYQYQHDPRLDNQTAIIAASNYGKLDALQSLLTVPFADPGFNDNYALNDAILSNHSQIVKCLLEDSRVDPLKLKFFPFTYCARYGYTDVVVQLLKDGRIDPKEYNNFPISLASSNGYVDIVKAFLNDFRTDPTRDSLKAAVLHGHLDIVKTLLQDHRVDPAADNNEAIRKASSNGNVAIVKALLDYSPIGQGGYL